MTVLVTGGTGYIGSHMIVELLNQGYDVVSFDNFCNASPEVNNRIKEIAQRDFVFYEADMLDANAIDTIFKNNKIDAVIHIAALKAVAESVGEPLKYYINNVSGSLNLFNTMKQYHVKKLVFSSSATVYGVPERLPLDEDCRTGEATNPYGSTKIMLEEILQNLYKSDNSWDIMLLRYFNPVGAHESGLIGDDQKVPLNLVPILDKIAQGLLADLPYNNEYPTSDGTCVRDYIHILDLVDGHIKALEAMDRLKGVRIYNLCTGKGSTVLEVVRAYEKASGVKIPLRISEPRPGDTAELYSSPKKAAAELGFNATRDLDKMCEDAWRFVQNH